LLNSEAKGNYIKQELVKEYKWSPRDSEVSLATVEGRDIVTYRTYNLEVKSTNSIGTIN
jgi:hypothetical protein